MKATVSSACFALIAAAGFSVKVQAQTCSWLQCGSSGQFGIGAAARSSSTISISLESSNGWTNAWINAGAVARSISLANCVPPLDDLSNNYADDDQELVTLPNSGTANGSIGAFSCADWIINDTCLGVHRTYAQAAGTLAVSQSNVDFQASKYSNSGFEVGTGADLGYFAAENGHSTLAFEVYGAPNSGSTTTLAIYFDHYLDLRWCPAFLSGAPTGRQLVHVVNVYVKIVGPTGATLSINRGVGFVSVPADTYSAPTGTGMGLLADYSTLSGQDTTGDTENINHTFPGTTSGQSIRVIGHMQSRSYDDTDHSQVADADGDGTIEPIGDRDAFSLGATYPAEAYSPFVDFDMDGDNDLADYVAFDSLSELDTRCRVDYDGNNVLDNDDEIVFVSNYFAGLPSADIGKSGGLRGPDGIFDNNDFVVL